MKKRKSVILKNTYDDINMPDILLKIKSVSPNTELLQKANFDKDLAEEEENEDEGEEFLEMDEQELRVQSLLNGADENDILNVYEKWEVYLHEKLKFPFEAKIFEYQEYGALKTGDRLIITGISGMDDLYGILVDVTKKRRQYEFPLCDLEVIDKKSLNYLPVSDYSFWFANYR